MNDREEQTTYFAKTDFRGKERQFGIRAKDRTRHMYVVGKTGMGKSTLLENMAAQDIQNGNGMAFIDPHGSAVETLLQYIPEERIKDVIYFAPFDIEHPISFNIMEDVGYDKRHLVVSGLMSAFKKIWLDQWSSRMEYILTNTLLALIEYPDSTLLDVNRMLVDKDFRKKVLAVVTDPIVKSFWEDEFAKYTDRYTQEATPAIQNKIGQFVSNPLIRNIVGQPKSSFDFREVMDNKKIVIMNLSKGRMGEQNADLIGSMLIIKIYLSAMSRADLPPHEIQKLPNFYFYVDEFQSFANETFADILSEARKYKLNLTIAHQYIEQMPDEVRSAVFGNVGTMVTFRVGAIDAEVLEKELSPTFTADDLVNLGIYQIYLKLMIDGLTSTPFSATTLPPIPLPEETFVDEVIENSRKTYARDRSGVEEHIKNRGVAESTTPKEERGTDNPSSKKFSQRPIPAKRTTPRNNTPSRPQKKDTHAPFKQAFKEQEINKGEGRKPAPHKDNSVSLQTLNSQRRKDSSPSSENAQALRSALAEALGNNFEKNGEEAKQPSDNTPPAPEKKKEEKSVPEVPEETLRETLKVDDEKNT